MTTMYRSWTNEPGDHLVEPANVLEQARALEAASKASGLDTADLVIAPTSTIAIPRYTRNRVESARPWPDVPPAALACPLFWLPPELAGRYMSDDDEMEPDAIYAARVCIALESAGLYDPEAGRWIDMLAAAGVDVDTQEGHDRVARWQAGAADLHLDALDLTEAIDEVAGRHGGDWLLLAAADASIRLTPIAALHSAEILLLRMETVGTDDHSADDACWAILNIAQEVFSYLDEEHDWWEAVAAAFEAGEPCTAVLAQADARLRQVVEAYLPIEQAAIDDYEKVFADQHQEQLETVDALEW